MGITRAKERLTLTSANQRMKNGETMFNRPSRFINEIPRYLLKQTYGAVIKEKPSFDFDKPASRASIYSKDRKNPFAGNPYIQKGLSAGTVDYTVGDRVKHFKFGEGTVTDMKKTDKDYEVTVSFEEFGQRKLRSSFAKLQKL